MTTDSSRSFIAFRTLEGRRPVLCARFPQPGIIAGSDILALAKMFGSQCWARVCIILCEYSLRRRNTSITENKPCKKTTCLSGFIQYWNVYERIVLYVAVRKRTYLSAALKACSISLINVSGRSTPMENRAIPEFSLFCHNEYGSTSDSCPPQLTAI
ncbi:hypothetical protein SDC9_45674 [bioreactor metagenome]|uniref:Uncharacterized protein n=1 Tax=bioreactor metagenome TaxID=1076179 RepID=A0A644W7G2_9ZZZZ